jgi:hypothetical protein
MSRLAWTETLDGWMSGRYQIELAAPRLWVLSRRPKNPDDHLASPVPAVVVRTAGSLRELKRLAEEFERRRLRRRFLLIHLLMTVLIVAGALVGASFDWDLTIPAVVAVFGIALRTFVVWVDQATGRAWSVVSDNYQ